MNGEAERLVAAQAALDAVDEELRSRRRNLRRLVGLGAITAAGFATQAWVGGFGYVMAWVLPTIGVTGAMWLKGRAGLRGLESARAESVAEVRAATTLLGDSKKILLTLLLIPALACSDFTPTVTEIEPGVLAVDTAPGATIEVVDWGGTGPAMVFLAGGGHTAHEFDELAPRLVDDFRAIGITRRGIGASSGAKHRVARDRIRDIARVLDALDIESAVLVGHSQGGLEAAEFAQAYPARCRGIVHLDSAYLGGEEELAEIFRTSPPPTPPARTDADLASTAALRAWIERTQGFRLPESELRAVNELDDSGRVLGPAPRDTGPEYGWFGKVPELQWDAVDCPGLGLFPVTAPLETWLPFFVERYDATTAEERSHADTYYRAFAAWTAERRADFARQHHNQTVEYPASGHYFFLNEARRDESLNAIRAFASDLGEGQ